MSISPEIAEEVIVVLRGCEDGCCRFDPEGPFDTMEDAERYAEAARNHPYYATVTTMRPSIYIMDLVPEYFTSNASETL